jgi:hypothetical protein
MEKENDKSKSTERSLHIPNENIDMVFQKYFKLWKEETINMSSSDRFENANYKSIIAMGWDAVPCIINQLYKKPDHLFDALESITGISAIKPDHIGFLRKMTDDWIAWYHEKYNKEQL